MLQVTELNNRKYASKNLIKRFLLSRFIQRIAQEMSTVKPARILDFGCGSGAFWQEMGHTSSYWPAAITGIDLDEAAILQAREKNIPNAVFYPAKDGEQHLQKGNFDCVICLEVLEHIKEPGIVLRKLCELQPQHIVLSVPNEPWFRICQMISLKNLSRLGNDIDHVQNWSANGFKKFVQEYINITKVDTSAFPFTVIVGVPK